MSNPSKEDTMETVDRDTYLERKYNTEALQRDIAAGGLGINTHPAQARELIRLDTVARRARAMDEARTLQNLIGGVTSSCLRVAIRDLQQLIDTGTEDQELPAERTARIYREREQELRRVTGNPAAIYYPPQWGMR